MALKGFKLALGFSNSYPTIKNKQQSRVIASNSNSSPLRHGESAKKAGSHNKSEVCCRIHDETSLPGGFADLLGPQIQNSDDDLTIITITQESRQSISGCHESRFGREDSSEYENQVQVERQMQIERLRHILEFQESKTNKRIEAMEKQRRRIEELERERVELERKCDEIQVRYDERLRSLPLV